jgi:hypothetical protein
MVNHGGDKKLGTVPDSIRRQISVLARQKKCRISDWTRDEPTEWQPHTVKDNFGEFFTDAGAWEFLADLLDAGHMVEEIVLRLPPGRKAYVVKKRIDSVHPEIYIKVRLGSGTIIGRSFHYSTFDE